MCRSLRTANYSRIVSFFCFISFIAGGPVGEAHSSPHKTNAEPDASSIRGAYLKHSPCRFRACKRMSAEFTLFGAGIFLLYLLNYSVTLACSPDHCQVRERCASTKDCSQGLFCSSCSADGDSSNTCHRYKATDAPSIRGGLPFNKYSWLTTHNSFAIFGETSKFGPRATFYNQDDSVSHQLNNGVRGFMLDMYDFLGDIWLCHSLGGVCYNYTAFEPAINTLKEMAAFLAANPTEIITIFIEDYVTSPNGLSQLFMAAGLTKYMFPVSSMPRDGGDWPHITDMISKNYRLLVFTSNHTKEASEGIAYNWAYVNENQYGDPGMQEGHCSNREESMPLSTTSRSLILINHFPSEPVQDQSCTYNSAQLLGMLPHCYTASGRRWPNYLAVDFFKLSDGGGVFEALDTINAGLLCGCSDISSCKLKLSYGVCPNASTRSGTSNSSMLSSSVVASPPATVNQNLNSKGTQIHCHICIVLLQVIVLSVKLYF